MPHAPVKTIQYASSGWNSQLLSAINSKNFVRIVIKGSLASELKGKLSYPSVCMVPAPPLSVPIPYPNITMPYCLANLPALLNLVMLAFTTKGYTCIKAAFDAHGGGKNNDELLIDLR